MRLKDIPPEQMKDHIKPDAVRLMNELYHIDMEAEGQHGKLPSDLLLWYCGHYGPQCAVFFPALQAAGGLGHGRPQLKAGRAFMETIRQIEKKNTCPQGYADLILNRNPETRLKR